MKFKIDCIKKVCDIHNIKYDDLFNNLRINTYTVNTEKNEIELLPSDKIKISKALNTIIPYFYGAIDDKQLYNKNLTLNLYEEAVKSGTLDTYYKNIGLDKFTANLLMSNPDTDLTDFDRNAIIRRLHIEAHRIKIDSLPVDEEIYTHLASLRPLSLKDIAAHQTEKICIAGVSTFAHAIEYVVEQTEAIAYASVSKNGMTLELVIPELHTEKVVKAALKENPLSFKYSELKTYDICLHAVKLDGINLEFVPDELRDHKMIMTALNSNGWAIMFVDNQTEEYGLTAVLQNTESVLYVDEDIRNNNLCVNSIYNEIKKRHNYLAI